MLVEEHKRIVEGCGLKGVEHEGMIIGFNKIVGGKELLNRKTVKFEVDSNPSIFLEGLSIVYDDKMIIFDNEKNYSTLINQMKKGNKIKTIFDYYVYRDILRTTDLHGFTKAYNKIKEVLLKMDRPILSLKSLYWVIRFYKKQCCL